MGLWKWQHAADLGFPQPSIVNGIAHTDLDEVDAWMKARVVDLTKQRIALLGRRRRDGGRNPPSHIGERK
jgi:hypothetical protein